MAEIQTNGAPFRTLLRNLRETVSTFRHELAIRYLGVDYFLHPREQLAGPRFDRWTEGSTRHFLFLGWRFEVSRCR